MHTCHDMQTLRNMPKCRLCPGNPGRGPRSGILRASTHGPHTPSPSVLHRAGSWGSHSSPSPTDRSLGGSWDGWTKSTSQMHSDACSISSGQVRGPGLVFRQVLRQPREYCRAPRRGSLFSSTTSLPEVQSSENSDGHSQTVTCGNHCGLPRGPLSQMPLGGL